MQKFKIQKYNVCLHITPPKCQAVFVYMSARVVGIHIVSTRISATHRFSRYMLTDDFIFLLKHTTDITSMFPRTPRRNIAAKNTVAVTVKLRRNSGVGCVMLVVMFKVKLLFVSSSVIVFVYMLLILIKLSQVLD